MCFMCDLAREKTLLKKQEKEKEKEKEKALPVQPNHPALSLAEKAELLWPIGWKLNNGYGSHHTAKIRGLFIAIREDTNVEGTYYEGLVGSDVPWGRRTQKRSLYELMEHLRNDVDRLSKQVLPALANRENKAALWQRVLNALPGDTWRLRVSEPYTLVRDFEMTHGPGLAFILRLHGEDEPGTQQCLLSTNIEVGTTTLYLGGSVSLSSAACQSEVRTAVKQMLSSVMGVVE